MSTPKALLPTLAERLARARGDLRMGLPVVLEGAGVMVMAAESLTAARLEAARALGEPVLAVSAWRAETLKARAYDGDIARLTVPGDATADWVRGVADPAADLTQPLRGPYRSLRDGDAGPCRLAVALVKSARLLPAAVVVEGAVGDAGLTALPAELLAEALAAEAPIADVISARVPLSAAPSRVHVFRPGDGGDEHYGIEIGRPDRAGPVLVRLHSACFTGDVLGSLKCDCGAQLQGALAAMAGEGAGVLLYLNQEGRGIGLANKMRAYSLQDQGFDTVEANHRLGFEDDERDFRTGAAILKEMGITTIRLMTNNPAKVAMMEASGLTVAERVPLAVGRTPENTGYLDVKARKSGHLL